MPQLSITEKRSGGAALSRRRWQGRGNWQQEQRRGAEMRHANTDGKGRVIATDEGC
ncbi:Uncharacterised protein [Pseudomonas aeruginosa]|nr:Uncharacterised protein [Pseudomonas aeruginosa]